MFYINKKNLFLSFLILLPLLTACAQKANTPEGFVEIKQVIPSVQYDIRYNSDNNLVGKHIDGYYASSALLTNEAVKALKDISDELELRGYKLKIFDAYRPQKAVNHFIKWSEDENDTKMKSRYYPYVDKKDLIKLGFIAKKSAHSRGSAVDLTLVDISSGKELDMGSSYDYLDKISAHGTTLITKEQTANRELLKNVMIKHGYKPYYKEWWHYTFINEPNPNHYFNFDIKETPE